MKSGYFEYRALCAQGPEMGISFTCLLAVLRAMQDLRSQSGIEPVLPAVEAQSLNRWTTGGVLGISPFQVFL